MILSILTGHENPGRYKLSLYCNLPFVLNKAYDQDDWDSDFEDEDTAGPGGGHAVPSGMGGTNLMPPKNTVHSGSSGDLNSVGRKSSVAASSSVTSKTSFNRFSTFVKSGGENYILGKLNAKVQEADIIQVVVSS